MTRKDLIWKISYLAISGGVFMIDQTTKAWATRTLRFDGDKSVISGFLNLAYAQNTGVAFSMLDDHGDAGRWGLSVVAFVAATLVLYFFWRTPRTDDEMVQRPRWRPHVPNRLGHEHGREDYRGDRPIAAPVARTSGITASSRHPRAIALTAGISFVRSPRQG